MNVYELNVSSPLHYHLTGKFIAPSDHWKHLDMPLKEYELFVMTDGVLYLSYDNIHYTVRKGEILLLPPLPDDRNHRKGYKKSQCSFYWLHFTESIIPPPVYHRLLFQVLYMNIILIRFLITHLQYQSRLLF